MPFAWKIIYNKQGERKMKKQARTTEELRQVHVREELVTLCEGCYDSEKVKQYFTPEHQAGMRCEVCGVELQWNERSESCSTCYDLLDALKTLYWQAATGLDVSATFDGQNNADALVKARKAIKKQLANNQREG
jgi:transcription initiation factor IIE alpha subunit